jgi:energy-converting hydrogenase Eha subunit A
MDKKEIEEAKSAVLLIKIFAVIGIVIAIGAFILAAWSWGLVTAAKEMPNGLFWKADTLPFVVAGFGFIVILICGFSLYSIGKVSKALHSVKSEILEEDKA